MIIEENEIKDADEEGRDIDFCVIKLKSLNNEKITCKMASIQLKQIIDTYRNKVKILLNTYDTNELYLFDRISSIAKDEYIFYSIDDVYNLWACKDEIYLNITVSEEYNLEAELIKVEIKSNGMDGYIISNKTVKSIYSCK